MNKIKKTPILALIIANLIPLYGVFFHTWDITTLVFLYWSENIVIFIFTILRMARAQGMASPKECKEYRLNPQKPHKVRTNMIQIFLIFFGSFTAVHGFFVVAFFGTPLTGVILLISFLSLFVSHGISYRQNFIDNNEYKRVSPVPFFMQPIHRIFIIHFVIGIGGVLLLDTGNALWALFLLIIPKIILDIILHIKEHKKLQSYETKSKTDTKLPA